MSQNNQIKPEFLSDPAPLSSDEQAYLRTLLSDRIENLDPYKQETLTLFKKIYEEEALKAWERIQKLIDRDDVSLSNKRSCPKYLATLWFF